MPRFSLPNQPLEPTEPQAAFPQKPAGPLKPILLAALGLLLVSGIVYGAFWYGTKKGATPKATPSPSGEVPEATSPAESNETAGWRSYTSDKYSFQIKLPEDVGADCDNYSLNGCAIRYTDSAGTPGFETLALHFYTKQEFEINDREKLLALKIGETAGICELPSPESCVYKRVEDFSGLTRFRVFENYNAWEVGKDKIEKTLINQKNDGYLVVSFYYDKSNLSNGRFSKKLFDRILSTFKFLEPNQAAQLNSGVITITMNAENYTGETGTATLTDLGGGQTKILLEIDNVPGGQLANIYIGSCSEPGSVKYPLTDVTNGFQTNIAPGSSETILNVSIKDLLSMLPLAIGVRYAGSFTSPFLASCGNLK